MIQNSYTKKCLSPFSSSDIASQAECDQSDESQWWHFRLWPDGTMNILKKSIPCQGDIRLDDFFTCGCLVPASRSPNFLGDGNPVRIVNMGAQSQFCTVGHSSKWKIAKMSQGWRYLSGGRGHWKDLLSTDISFDNTSVVDVNPGDFDGDGTTDIFRIIGTEWYVYFTGTFQWRRVGSSSAPLEELRFGDFNGDDIVDIFFKNGRIWQVRFGPIPYNHQNDWQRIGSYNLPLSQIKFGDIDDYKGTDIITFSNYILYPNP